MSSPQENGMNNSGLRDRADDVEMNSSRSAPNRFEGILPFKIRPQLGEAPISLVDIRQEKASYINAMLAHARISARRDDLALAKVIQNEGVENYLDNDIQLSLLT